MTGEMLVTGEILVTGKIGEMNGLARTVVGVIPNLAQVEAPQVHHRAEL